MKNEYLYSLIRDFHQLEARIATLEAKASPILPPARFKLGQVVINTLNNASFTIRKIRYHIDQWQYSNTLPKYELANWICETKLRELNDTELGR